MSDVVFLRISLKFIRLYRETARAHPKRQIYSTTRVLQSYPPTVPIVVDEKYIDIDEHLIDETLRLNNCDEVNVEAVMGRDKAQLIALRLSLNKLAEKKTCDNVKLKHELKYMTVLSFDMELTAFDASKTNMCFSLGAYFDKSVEEIAAAALDPDKCSTVSWGDARDGSLLPRLLPGRLRVGIEISTGYVEVAVRRWQKMTGRASILEATSETLDELTARRVVEGAIANAGGGNA